MNTTSNIVILKVSGRCGSGRPSQTLTVDVTPCMNRYGNRSGHLDHAVVVGMTAALVARDVTDSIIATPPELRSSITGGTILVE